MKKSLVLFTTLLLLLTGMMFTSCQHSYVADEDTWYHTCKTVSNCDLDMWFYYTTSNTSIEIYDGTTKKPLDLPAGITVVISPTVDTNIAATVRGYSVKTFPLNREVEVEEDVNVDTSEGSVKIKANGTLMDALYVANKTDFKAEAGKKPIAFESKIKKVESLKDLGVDLQGKGWKTIVKEVINSVL